MSSKFVDAARLQFIVVAHVKIEIEPMRQLNLKAYSYQILLGRFRYANNESPIIYSINN